MNEVEAIHAPGVIPVPSVSVICPTYQRPECIRQQVENFCAQTFSGDLEMIILDDSPEPSSYLYDPEYRERGIRYYYMPEKRRTIGSKLHFMQQVARGEIIAVFDDDDYYAPNYIKRMVELLGDADFCTLSRWFAYSQQQAVAAYWATDLLLPFHFTFSPWEPIQPVSTEGWDPNYTVETPWDYGFTYVWRKSVFPRVEIGDITFEEVCWDRDFYVKLKAAGFSSVCAPDIEGLVIHVVHPGATSRMFPQYILPGFLLKNYFPQFTPVKN